MKTIYKEIGHRITMLRYENELTQAQLAEMLDISVKHCSEVERGLSSLSIEKLVDLCSILSTNLDFLVRGITPAESETSAVPHTVIELFNTSDNTQRELLLKFFLLFKEIRNSNNKDQS